MKKLLSIILAAAAVLIFAVAAFAEDAPSVSVSSASAKPGETVTVDVALQNNPGIAAMMITLKYDTEALTLTKYENKNIFDGMTVSKNVLWDSSSDVTVNGVLATFTFTVSESAKGSYIVEAIVRSCNNSEQDDIAMTSTSGTVTVLRDSEVYTVTYDANGGINAPAAQQKTEDVDLVLASAEPEKAYTVTFDANGGTVSQTTSTVSCTFNGWNTKQDGTGTAYSAAGKYTLNADVTLYAQWTDSAAGTLPAPSKNGYTFDGWFTSATDGTQVTPAAVITASQTLYAHWTAEKTPDITDPDDPADPSFILGDVDADGLITVADARLALRRAIGLESYAAGSAEYLACDVDLDGEVKVDDARLILRASIGLDDPENWKKS